MENDKEKIKVPKNKTMDIKTYLLASLITADKYEHLAFFKNDKSKKIKTNLMTS